MKTKSLLSLAMLGALATGTVHAEFTKAGTVIQNTATVIINDVETQSNTVLAKVLPRPAFDIVYRDGSDGTTATSALPNGYEQSVAPGKELVTGYLVVNTGNTDQTISLAANTVGSPNVGHQVAYYLDSNNDGVLSDSERSAGPISAVKVAWDDPATPADEGQVGILQVITVPGTATAAQQFAASPQGTGQVFDAATRTTKTVQETPEVLELQYSRALVAASAPAVAIGPVGNPTAPEGTEADTQTQAFALVNTASCFTHTVQNIGAVRDDFTLSVGVSEGQAASTVTGADGQPLPQPLSLEPGQKTDVKVCYQPQQAGSLKAVVTIQGALGTSNATTDIITQVETKLMNQDDLRKSYQAYRTKDGQQVTLKQGDNVQPGDTIVYTLSVHNPYSRPLVNVVVTDPLPALVDVVSLSEGGAETTPHTVTWTLPELAPNETRTLTITTKVSEQAKDGELLKNVFTLVSPQFPGKTFDSNEVQTGVWRQVSAIQIQKEVNQATVSIGDRLTYTLKITNNSDQAIVTDTNVIDEPPVGIVYIPGTSTLNGKPLADPIKEGGKMIWKDVTSIPAHSTIVMTYDTRVTPDAVGELVNYVQVNAMGAGQTAIASSKARASSLVKRLLQFAEQGDILGTVYVDRNRDGVFDDKDTPVDRARVLLAGGREVLTDEQGRYHFANVPFGQWALRLDPVSVPYQPLSTPESSSQGTQVIELRGLTTVNFPLAPLAGGVSARSTEVQVGDVRIVKTLEPVQGGYAVTLRVTTPTLLENVSLTDPLPTGATLGDKGQNTLSGTLPAGETVLTYQIKFSGTTEAAMTQPTLSWRN